VQQVPGYHALSAVTAPTARGTRAVPTFVRTTARETGYLLTLYAAEQIMGHTQSTLLPELVARGVSVERCQQVAAQVAQLLESVLNADS
jgi:hypothetical protein